MNFCKEIAKLVTKGTTALPESITPEAHSPEGTEWRYNPEFRIVLPALIGVEGLLALYAPTADEFIEYTFYTGSQTALVRFFMNNGLQRFNFILLNMSYPRFYTYSFALRWFCGPSIDPIDVKITRLSRDLSEDGIPKYISGRYKRQNELQ